MEQKNKILIVDDEPRIVETLTMTFEDDFEVVGTTSPEEAVKALSEHEISVIVADQRMPRSCAR